MRLPFRRPTRGGPKARPRPRPRTKPPGHPAQYGLRRQRLVARPPAGRVFVDGAIGYATLVLTNGVVVHLFGEDHRYRKTCRRDSACGAACRTTLPQYAADLAVRARDTGRRLDVFLEKEFGEKGYGIGMYTVPHVSEEVVDASSLSILGLQFPDTEHLPRSGRVRAHRVDIRSGANHPLLDWNLRGTIDTQSFRTKVFDPMLFSNRYSNNAAKVANQVSGRPVTAQGSGALLALRAFWDGRTRKGAAYAQRFPRNATLSGGADVSRVRKALLKLRPDVADRLADTASKRADRTTSTSNLMVLLMDVYTVARMLYYAGYGVTRPPEGTSAVQFGHYGVLHTWNQHVLFQGSGVVARASRLQLMADDHGCVHAPKP